MPTVDMSSKFSFKDRLPWRRNKNATSITAPEASTSRAGSVQEPETLSATPSLSGPAHLDSDSAKRLERYGLFRLYPANEDVELIFGPDIVAVHGLNGDAHGTWTHSNGKLWLRDFLATQMPNSRVFTFGYNSGVAFSKSKGTIDQFARSLLNALKRERRAEASCLCCFIQESPEAK